MVVELGFEMKVLDDVERLLESESEDEEDAIWLKRKGDFGVMDDGMMEIKTLSF
ncbi:hypothetical protein Hanom_Chr04g00281781 [Helianthus anomalus]